MLDNQDVAVLIQSDKKKKSVSWIDKKDEGSIDKDHLHSGTAASPKKATLLNEMKELIQNENYTEIEAASAVGRSLLTNGQYIYKDPMFYDTREAIHGRRERKKPNPNSFFTLENIGTGVVILGVTAALGMALLRK